MPNAHANCSKRKFTLVTLSAAIAIDHKAARAYPLLENKYYSSGMILLKIILQKLAILLLPK